MGDKPSEPEFTIPKGFSFDENTGEDEQGNINADEADGASAEMSELLLNAQEENAKLKDRLLRVVADMENLRKRTQREINDTRSYAIADFARDMLNATDNLSRALSVIPEEVRQNGDAQTKSLIEGIEMTNREMQRLMQKNGVKPILAEGEKFNPHKHQAMFEVPNPNIPAGIVVQVVQTGFEIGDRVLRPAMVGVSKGGPKAGTGASAQDEQSQSEEAEGFVPNSVHLDKQV